MSYAEHLRALLRPLGVYRLEAQSLSGGELEALGKAFDELYEQMEGDLCEALPVTATNAGLSAYEELLGYPRLTEDTQQRRNAILGLLNMPARGSCAASLQAAGAFTGTSVLLDDALLPDHLTVYLGWTTLPDNWAAVREYLDRLMPCHVEISYETAET